MKFKHLFRRGFLITFLVAPLVRCFIYPAVRASLNAGYPLDPHFIPYFKAQYMEIWLLAANSSTVMPSYNLHLLGSIVFYVGLAAAGAALLAVGTLGRQRMSERVREVNIEKTNELIPPYYQTVPSYQSTKKLSPFGEESQNSTKFLQQTAVNDDLRPKVDQLKMIAEDLISDAHKDQPPVGPGKPVQIADDYQDGAIIQLSDVRRKVVCQNDKVETVDIYGEAALLPASLIGKKSHNPQISRREPLHTDPKMDKIEIPMNPNKMEVTDNTNGLVEVYLTKRQLGDIGAATRVSERLQKGSASEWSFSVYMHKATKLIRETAELSAKAVRDAIVPVTEAVLLAYSERIINRLLVEFGWYIWFGFGMILLGLGGLVHAYYTFSTPTVDPNNVIYLLPDADVFMIRWEQTTNAVYKALLQNFLPNQLQWLIPMSDAETQLVKDFVVNLKKTNVTGEELKVILKSLQKK